MFEKRTCVYRLLPLLAILFLLGAVSAFAQDDEPAAEKQYREDYDRLQKIIAVSDVTKRSDALLLFLKERPDSKMADYAQGQYLQLVESLAKGEKWKDTIVLCEKLIKQRPRVGETYYFYGAALKNSQRVPEALDALAKCAVIKSNASRKAREFLEYTYKAQNNGSIAGLDKILKKAEADIAK
jgi:hypothetical protein